MFAPTKKLLFLRYYRNRQFFFDVQNSQQFYIASIRERASPSQKLILLVIRSRRNYKSKCLCKYISDHCVRVLFLDIGRRYPGTTPPKSERCREPSRPVHCETLFNNLLSELSPKTTLFNTTQFHETKLLCTIDFQLNICLHHMQRQ